LKVCDLTQFYSPVSGGVKRYVSEKIRYVEEATNDEHLLIIPGERDEIIDSGRSRTCTIRSPLISKTSRYRMLLRLGAVEQILEREKPDVIESGDPYQLAWKAIASGNALGIPVIGFYHSHFPEAYLRSAAKYFGPLATDFTMNAARRYVRCLYNRFARTLVPSPALGTVLEEWGVENVANLDLGVNTSVFYPRRKQAARAALGIPAPRFILLYIGRLAPEKNTQLLFDTFARLHRIEPDRFHLMIVGDGAQRSKLEALRLELDRVAVPKPSPITWLPYCADSNQLAEIYNAADLFVHPGIQETFGLVALESQACGTPVVGIRGSYMDRIILTGQAHWANENSAESLAAAIRETADAPPEDSALLSRRVAQRYSWAQVFARLFEIYHSLAKP
jgi:alpha-1,6-mannosyltransferase